MSSLVCPSSVSGRVLALLLTLPAVSRAQDDRAWQAIPGSPVRQLLDLEVADLDGVPTLVTAGTSILGAGVSVTAWDGSAWSALGPSFFHNASDKALLWFDDGSGAALYYNHLFGVERLDPGGWTSLGGPSCCVTTLGVDATGTTPRLIAAGTSSQLSGNPMGGVARWDGIGWTSIGASNRPIRSPSSESVNDVATFDDGSGPALYAAGNYDNQNGVARWDGIAWSYLNLRCLEAHALAVYDDGTGPALFAGTTGSEPPTSAPMAGVSVWDGNAWTEIGRVGRPNFESVHALAVHDDGTGPALYAGGDFSSINGVTARRIARWDGIRWSKLGLGVMDRSVTCLASFDDGSGPALYVGGNFTSVGHGIQAMGLARWRGRSPWVQEIVGAPANPIGGSRPGGGR